MILVLEIYVDSFSSSAEFFQTSYIFHSSRPTTQTECEKSVNIMLLDNWDYFLSIFFPVLTLHKIGVSIHRAFVQVVLKKSYSEKIWVVVFPMFSEYLRILSIPLREKCPNTEFHAVYLNLELNFLKDVRQISILIFTHLFPMHPFYTPWKYEGW